MCRSSDGGGGALISVCAFLSNCLTELKKKLLRSTLIYSLSVIVTLFKHVAQMLTSRPSVTLECKYIFFVRLIFGHCADYPQNQSSGVSVPPNFEDNWELTVVIYIIINRKYMFV